MHRLAAGNGFYGVHVVGLDASGWGVATTADNLVDWPWFDTN